MKYPAYNPALHQLASEVPLRHRISANISKSIYAEVPPEQYWLVGECIRRGFWSMYTKVNKQGRTILHYTLDIPRAFKAYCKENE